jgi:hypothetical protein
MNDVSKHLCGKGRSGLGLKRKGKKRRETEAEGRGGRLDRSEKMTKDWQGQRIQLNHTSNQIVFPHFPGSSSLVPSLVLLLPFPAFLLVQFDPSPFPKLHQSL